MRRSLSSLTAAALLLAAAACSDLGGPSPSDPLADAFASLPFGYDIALHSFGGPPEGAATEWIPGGGLSFGGDGRRGGPGGPGGPAGPRALGGPAGPGGGPGSMMCGGLGGPFGGRGFDFGFGRGPFGGVLSGDCAFDAASGRVVCDPLTRNGLTITRSAAFSDANGQVQSAFDSATTNTINTRVSVSGTITRRNGAVSSVQHASDRTVSGLAPGSTERTINGASAGSESTAGTNDQGQFTADRVIGDTTQNVVIPVPSGAPTYPTSGTVIRAMRVTLTYAGQEPRTSTRREVVTYDGSSTATVVITHNGETKTCAMPLPRGRLTCQ